MDKYTSYVSFRTVFFFIKTGESVIATQITFWTPFMFCRNDVVSDKKSIENPLQNSMDTSMIK